MGKIAQRFQEYEVRGMLVELKSLSSDYAASLSLGSIFMSADYNVLGPAPPNKQALENMEYASSCKPSRSLIMPIECDPRNAVDTHLYVAINNDYQGGDKRLYDLAKIYVGSQGIPTQSTPIAEMWITYEIALFKPIISQESIGGIENDCHFLCQGISSEFPLGTNIQRAPGSSVTILADSTTISFPAGVEDYYLVSMLYNGTSTGGVSSGKFPSVIFVTNTEPQPAWNDGSAFFQSNTSISGEGLNCTRICCTFVVHCKIETAPYVPVIKFADDGVLLGMPSLTS